MSPVCGASAMCWWTSFRISTISSTSWSGPGAGRGAVRHRRPGPVHLRLPGRDCRCFQRLQEEHPGVKEIHLTENYRSAPAILDTALAVIGHNPGGGPNTDSPLPRRSCRATGPGAGQLLRGRIHRQGDRPYDRRRGHAGGPGPGPRADGAGLFRYCGALPHPPAPGAGGEMPPPRRYSLSCHRAGGLPG